jgi:hypothetical protein
MHIRQISKAVAKSLANVIAILYFGSASLLHLYIKEISARQNSAVMALIKLKSRGNRGSNITLARVLGEEQ